MMIGTKIDGVFMDVMLSWSTMMLSFVLKFFLQAKMKI